MISHDRWFLDLIANHILAFKGHSVVRSFEGNFTEWATLSRQATPTIL